MTGLKPVSLDPRSLRDAFACFPSGVTALCAMGPQEGGAPLPVGFAASSFTTVSIDPPLVSVCIQSNSTTWPKLKDLPRLGVSVLGEDHDGICRQLAQKTGDRFAGIAWKASPDGAIFIEGATAWLDCSIWRQYPAGDHEIILLEIHNMRIEPHVAPLVFHGSKFRRLQPHD